MPQSRKKYDQEFVPAQRFAIEKNIASLEAIAYNASLAVNRELVAALDGGARYSNGVVESQQALAAKAQSEIIMRRIFN